MRRVMALLFLITAASFAGNKASDPEPGSFEIEPPLLIPNRDKEPAPEPKPSMDSAPDVDLAKLEKQFERAKQSAAGAERFWKIGALSKVEAEQRALRLFRLESELANARLVKAKEEMLTKQRERGELEQEDLRGVETTLALAIERAHAAAAKRERAELDAAEANVHRQEKLLALGSARKSDVARAEQKLAELKAQKN
jgi:hypothetical protein